MTAYPVLEQHIDGEWRSGRGDGVTDVADPATGAVLGGFAHADAGDLDEAAAAAARGFAVWRRLDPAERTRIIRAACALIRERAHAIAAVLTTEGGKPLAESRREVLRCADIVEWDAEEGRRIGGRIVPSRPGMRQMVLREPVGVVLAFIAWNFPASFVGRKVGAALSAGCSMILKAPSETPGTVVELVRCFADAGLPSGVLNLVLGRPQLISEQLVSDPRVRAVTLTGSTDVGRIIAGLAARHLKPCTLELGGHAPVVICADCDPAAVAAQAVTAKFRSNAGQVCVSPTRFLVAEEIYEPFIEEMAGHALRLRVGNGREPDTEMGPLVNAARVDAIRDLVEDARGLGAVVKAGGGPIEGKGLFFQPTVLADVPEAARAMREEPFGPLALVTPFASLDDAVETANATPYGLAAYCFTSDAGRAARLTDEIECGYLAINHFASANVGLPFGGVKESGHGREGGLEGVSEFLSVKSVSHLTS